MSGSFQKESAHPFWPFCGLFIPASNPNCRTLCPKFRAVARFRTLIWGSAHGSDVFSVPCWRTLTLEGASGVSSSGVSSRSYLAQNLLLGNIPSLLWKRRTRNLVCIAIRNTAFQAMALVEMSAQSLQLVYSLLAPLWVELSFLLFFSLGYFYLRTMAFGQVARIPPRGPW